MKRTQLSNNFYLDEFTRSTVATRFGINNRIVEGGITYTNLKRLCENVLQPLRDALGPVTILSGYRSKQLNKKIKGSSNSQHISGLAGDIVVAGYTPMQVAQWIRDNIKGYDQLILEFNSWVHISVPSRNNQPRNECLTAIKAPRLLGGVKTEYITGITSFVYKDAA